MRSSALFPSLAILSVGFSLLIDQTASSPSNLDTTIVSSSSEHRHKLAKCRWTFWSFNKPFGGPKDATMITPWYILYNMIYNQAKTVGTQETVLYGVDQTTVHWGNILKIAKIRQTSNVPKSYAFLGMTSDLNHKIEDYSSIPSTYTWSRQRGKSGFKGNVCYDLIISNGPNKRSDHELMLWLKWEGGQLPIGAGDKTIRIKNLYGQDWTLYQGINKDINVPVRSLLPDRQYKNSFRGDMKDWLMKLVEASIFREDAYIWTANLGMETFWGDSTFNAYSSLQLLWNGNQHRIGYKPPGYKQPPAGSVVPGYEKTR
ncbi:family 12 glycoside hydrolase [Melampsora americana]|nr:family 12 glycoside hydrolase [Melampsora americana]